MPFTSKRPLLHTAVCLATVAAAAITVSDAQAQRGMRGGSSFHPTQTFRPQTFRPQTFRPQTGQTVGRQQHFTPQTHFQRPQQGFTQSNIGRQNLHHNPNPAATHFNPTGQQGHPPAQTTFTAKPLGVGALTKGPGKPFTFKSGGKSTFPVVHMQNKSWPILKGKKFIWFGGYKHFFIPVGLLGVALIGGSYWYPDGYVSIAGPLCTGYTPDGCLLEWRTVDFEDGGSATQCVQYCPQAGPPPAQVATLPPPPPVVANGNCQVTIYENTDFSGLSAPTSDNQPALSETGWKDEISSIQVEAGTWDFFSDENFGGDSIRMAAGSYPKLVPEWNKRIGSFMCVEPGSPGAYNAPAGSPNLAAESGDHGGVK